MRLKLKMFYGKESDIKEWKHSLNSHLIDMISDESIGCLLTGIDCRESLYGIIQDFIEFSKIIQKRNINIKVKINTGENYKEIKNFLDTSVFGEYLDFSEDGWLKNKSNSGCPVIYSTTVLIINKYIGYYSPRNHNSISIQILKEISTGNRTLYIMDYIYTAFFIYVLLNPEYKYFTRNYFRFSRAYHVNGPGSEIYGYYKKIHNIPNPSGYDHSYEWWQKKEIKDLLEQIVIKHSLTNIEKKILRTFMEK